MSRWHTADSSTSSPNTGVSSSRSCWRSAGGDSDPPFGAASIMRNRRGAAVRARKTRRDSWQVPLLRERFHFTSAMVAAARRGKLEQVAN